MVAAIILACAAHVAMIVVGRVFQGVAVSTLLAFSDRVCPELNSFLVGYTNIMTAW